jgi:hypothetical protein
MPYNIIDLPISPDKKIELMGYLDEVWREAVNARANQIEGKFRHWMDNYAGKPKEETRTTPWPNASNFVPHLIRMHTDILNARLLGIIFGTKPFWMPKTFIEAPHDWLEDLGSWLEYESFYNIGIYHPIDSGILRSLKSGFCVLKAPWVVTESWLGSSTAESEEAFTSTRLLDEGIQLKPIAFDDYYPFPITANNLEEVQIHFHKLRFTKMAVEQRARLEWWDDTAAKALVAGPPPQETDTARASQALDAGVDINPHTGMPYKAIEAWLDYPIANDGRMYKICVVFNPHFKDAKGYLKGYFQPSSKGLNPFIGLCPMPREELIFGYSCPEIIESSQEEMAQIHNWRRDSNTIANTPGWKKRRYPDVPNPGADWYPGKVWELEDMADLEIIQFGGNYNSLMEEESFLMNWVERIMGSGAPSQGQGAGTLDGKRGVYSSQGTMALLSEGNNRLDIYLKRLRYSFHKLGNLIYSSNRDWRPDGAEYTAWGQRGEVVKRSFQFREPEGYRGLFFEIGASNGGANRELDRNNLLLMANTMAGYYRQVTEAAGVITQLPEGHPMRETLLQILDGARDLANRLLFAFDVDDRNKLAPDIRQVLGGTVQQSNESNQQAGLPTNESPVGIPELQGLSGLLAQVTGQSSPGAGNGNGFG